MSDAALSPQRPGDPAIEWGAPTGRRCTNAEIVTVSGVPSSSIHHYLKLGLIPQPARTTADAFVYDERHVKALAIVRGLRQRGRTLDEVRQALPELWCVDADQLDSVLEAHVAGQTIQPDPRARLIDAAIWAFAQQGYAQVTVAAVCARAEVAKGTFYRHFDNKDDLFLAAARAVVDRAVSALANDVQAGVAASDGPRFASHLRGGLPLLFELAKCSLQDSGPNAHTAVTLFVDFVERLGQVINADVPPSEQARQGGAVVMFAVVDVFARLLDPELARVPSDEG